MEAEHRKILVALDGSEQSFEAARYVSRIVPPEKTEVVLFHVMSKIPEAYWDLEKYPAGYRAGIIGAHAWEVQQRRQMEEFMDRTRKTMVEAGFPEAAVRAEMHERKVGIARDIVFESQRGYNCVVAGRTGASQIKDIILGSIAGKLVGKMAHAPLWVIGEAPNPEKVLVAMDRSEGAMEAVEHTGRMLGGSDARVTLIHVIRGVQPFTHDQPKEEKEWLDKVAQDMDEAQKEMEGVLQNAQARLVKAGLKQDHVDHKIVSKVPSRAATVIEEAASGGYGTIVVGRRGLSRIQEFFIGRVGHKILQMAKERAVWVVS
jgi:nucleotide-binding universal stress UspA family protein